MGDSTEETKVSSIKHDWYQTDTAVTITVLMKNIQEKNLQLDFNEEYVKVDVLVDEVQHNLEYRLAHKIVPDNCSYKITPLKIEIKLAKLEGIRWDKLEGDPNIAVPKSIPQATSSTENPAPLGYPTSKKGKDWSAIEKNIKEQEAKEKPEGEEALNKLFQEIYGKGSDEVKKAMNKSFMESGGTVLSTNWEEIKKDKVGVKPPDGMEFKKWE